ncbi:hypothetical protein EV138_3414 [Kribbella voronezhensis]|uniref:Ig-like domain-containing protein n=1 Tax=Kribbella voronezhensis TaxID=2512212 RepID=A0A4R7TEL6_9ACTN|nr:hypothetical protein [Kribbella voronezhensis]TDU89837.1 hypothetical protein EV138_3414 [Kribbella voronezhensis]
MRKSALAVLPVALVAATLSGPSAQAVGVAQIGWTDATHTNIRISWPAHTGPLRVVSKSPLSADRVLADQTSADQVVIAKGQLQVGSTDVMVEVRDATSKELVAQTTHFDTIAPYPSLDWPAKAAAGGAITVSWTFESSTGAPDSTPNDPLDVTPTSARIRMTGTNGCTWTKLPAVNGQHGSTTLPYQKPPFRVGTYADTEWGASQDQGLAVVNFAVSQKVPASTPYGDDIRVPFTSDAIRPGHCSNGVASAPYKVSVQNAVDLQTRNSSTAGWRSTSGGAVIWPALTPKVFRETSIGAREYRTVAYNDYEAVVIAGSDPEVNWVVGYSAVTPPVAAVTPYKLMRAMFSPATVTLGQKTTAVIGVRPYSNVTGIIQRWNGTAWVTHSSLAIRSGDGTYSYKPTVRGKQTFRFLVPSSTYGGLKINWIATNAFSLTVR